MNVIGVLVHAVPERVSEVEIEIAAMDGVEVHAATGDGRLVVTAVDIGERFASDSLMAMNHVAGVIGTSLVYHASEPDDVAA
ncbi:chaperone NapD [Pinisolibacter aquiterrae]|uniref:chaperone NapD n=1 Tax=Pinisolibacter aquiterrae TaxID=2815579 RepID=UPI001C3CEE46|nr:chaperone NapD [Pinisolibacter aquiterrae]MBV5265756.1 chaperone NapD [Pinisolibacter aquiterrae]MCC8236679.1 chaperone NapD [Pinisolibacter aquiterrae]